MSACISCNNQSLRYTFWGIQNVGLKCLFMKLQQQWDIFFQQNMKWVAAVTMEQCDPGQSEIIVLLALLMASIINVMSKQTNSSPHGAIYLCFFLLYSHFFICHLCHTYMYNTYDTSFHRYSKNRIDRTKQSKRNLKSTTTKSTTVIYEIIQE